MAESIVTFPSIGSSQASFSFSFDYLASTDIDAFVEGVSVFANNTSTGTAVGGNTYTVAFSSSGSKTLTFSPAVPQGSTVRIERNTALTTKAVDFSDGAVLTEIALDSAIDQLFFATQESNDKTAESITVAPDNKWDGQGKVIKNVADPVANTDAVNKQFISTNLPNINTVAGINTEVTTVAGIASDVTAVVADQADIGIVAGLTTEIGLLGTVDAVADMNTLGTADVVSDMNTLGTASNVTNMNTLAGINSDITTVSGIQANVTAVAGDEADIGTVATNITNVNTVAGIDANVTTVAGIQANVTTVAGIQANVTTVATNDANVTLVAGNATNINAVAGQTTNLQNVTNNLTAIQNAAQNATDASASQIAAANSASAAALALDSFDDRYLGVKSSDPTVDNDSNALVEGALYFSSTANEMRVYDGSNWIAASSAGGASLLEYKYTATAGQTTFTGADDASNTLSYTVANLIVILNGVILENGSDYTATNGSSVVLASGAAVNDELNIIAFKSFTTADMVSKTNGGAFSGNVDFNSGVDVLGGALSFGTSKWSIELDAGDNDLNFKYNGTTVFKLASTGEVVSANDITAFGTP